MDTVSDPSRNRNSNNQTVSRDSGRDASDRPASSSALAQMFLLSRKEIPNSLFKLERGYCKAYPQGPAQFFCPLIIHQPETVTVPFPMLAKISLLTKEIKGSGTEAAGRLLNCSAVLFRDC